LKEFSLPGKLRTLVEVTLENVRCEVKTPNGISDPFITRKGLRQGDVLSFMLFNISLQKAVRVALAYTDDIVITGRYKRAVKEAFI
jgi:hypothetical protein